MDDPLDDIGPHCEREEDLGPEIERMLKALVEEALERGASELHLEPARSADRGAVVIRHRVAGRLIPAARSVPFARLNLLLAKLKILAGMDITQRKLPQTGSFRLASAGRNFSILVRTLPTVHGESCALGIVERSAAPPPLAELGMLPDTEAAFRALLAGAGDGQEYGLILVCGPSGSGRRTTLYSALAHLRRPQLKLVALDESDGYELDGVSHVRVHGHFPYAMAIRQLLYPRTDALLLANVGDCETAQLALKAALSGQLVLAAAHVGNAPAALVRLLDMGLPVWDIAGAVKAVLAQRLAPRLCDACKLGAPPSPEEAALFSGQGLGVPARLFSAGRDEGCARCRGSGHHGMQALHELLVMTPATRALLGEDFPERRLREHARAQGARSLVQDGLQKAAAGLICARELSGIEP